MKCTFTSCKSEGKEEYTVEAGTLGVCEKHVFMFEFYFAKKWGVPKEQYRYPFLYEK